MNPKGYSFGYEKQWVGIDVCQKYLDVYLRPLDKLFQVSNNKVGINKIVTRLTAIKPELTGLKQKSRPNKAQTSFVSSKEDFVTRYKY